LQAAGAEGVNKRTPAPRRRRLCGGIQKKKKKNSGGNVRAGRGGTPYRRTLGMYPLPGSFFG
jgi:hypothetical protein